MSSIIGIGDIILQKTKEGKIKWESVSDSEFYAEVGGRRVYIEKIQNRVTAAISFALSLSDGDGNIIERIHRARSDAGLMIELHSVARRNALDIDTALSEVESALKML